jgi:hydrogenase maturation factor
MSACPVCEGDFHITTSLPDALERCRQEVRRQRDELRAEVKRLRQENLCVDCQCVQSENAKLRELLRELIDHEALVGWGCKVCLALHKRIEAALPESEKEERI